MDFDEIIRGFCELWDTKPGAVILLILAFILFILLAIDTWLHKHKRHKRPR